MLIRYRMPRHMVRPCIVAFPAIRASQEPRILPRPFTTLFSGNLQRSKKAKRRAITTTSSELPRTGFAMAGTNNQKPQYDDFATSYDLVWTVPAVAPLLPLLKSSISSIGPLDGASVLDLATGTGIGLRLVRAAGASQLVGVDISPQMLEIAKVTTPGAEFHTADCSKPLGHLGLEPGRFDVVLGVWLLNQCPSVAELNGLWANVATYLKPGGKFVGIIENHDIVHPVGVQSFKYGAKETRVTEVESGLGWSVHIEFQTQPKIEIDGFRFRREFLESAAKDSGMGEISYHKPGMEDVREALGSGDARDEVAGWWDELLDEPPNFVIVSHKL